MMDSFIAAVEAEPGTTYGRLLSAMRARIRDGQGSRRLPGRLGSFVRWMIPSSDVQVSSIHHIDRLLRLLCYVSLTVDTESIHVLYAGASAVLVRDV